MNNFNLQNITLLNISREIFSKKILKIETEEPLSEAIKIEINLTKGMLFSIDDQDKEAMGRALLLISSLFHKKPEKIFHKSVRINGSSLIAFDVFNLILEKCLDVFEKSFGEKNKSKKIEKITGAFIPAIVGVVGPNMLSKSGLENCLNTLKGNNQQDKEICTAFKKIILNDMKNIE